MSSTTEFAELHELIGSLRRCVTSLASRYGDSPATRRIVNDAERILNDIDRLDIDAEELELARGVVHHHHAGGENPDPGHPVRHRLLARRRRRGCRAARDKRVTIAHRDPTTSKGNRERTHRRPQGDRRLLAEPCRDSAAHPAHRPLVAVAADRGPGFRRVRDLRDGAGVPAEQLLRRGIQLPDAVLLTVHQQGLRRRRPATSGRRSSPTCGGFRSRRHRCRSCCCSG